MECSCDISVGLDGPCTVLAAEWSIARKPQKCQECSREIPPKEAYYRETIKDYDMDDDDMLITCKTCRDCMSLRDNMMRDFFIGKVRETISDHIWDCGGEMPEEYLAKLTPAARAWVCGQIEAAWAWDDEVMERR